MEPDKHELVTRLLEYTTEQVITYGRALIEAGADITGMGDSIAGPDVCSPGQYRQFALPYERRVVETLAAEGKRISLHICGDATRIIEDMVDTGSQLLAVDYKIDRAAAKAAARGVTSLIGTVDPSEILARGHPEDVRAAVRSDLEILADGGGFILAPGCALPYETPDENIMALVETVRDEGRYD
jgi:MtaA/CmuA family methyltransferase